MRDFFRDKNIALHVKLSDTVYLLSIYDNY